MTKCPQNGGTKHKSTRHSHTYTREVKRTRVGNPERSQNIVNLDWIRHYDELLSKHGYKLNPPRLPGDREGIKIEGANDKVSNEVIRRYDELNRLEKKK